MVRVRFAPSPTGPLHIGGVRTALYNYLFAKKMGGKMLLRLEDTDQNRFVPGAEAYIAEALAWVGITLDESPALGGPHAPYRQSERKAIYRQYAEKLVAEGKAYYAFDTSEALDALRKQFEAEGSAFQYNAISRTRLDNSLNISTEETASRLSAGEPSVIRLKINAKEEVRFQDLVRGWVHVHNSQLNDTVLLKADGMPTYHLANIVDDHLMEITHVIRGEEWLPSAPLHILLYQAFGWEHPQFAHLPLLLKPEGNGKLSKRDADLGGFPVFPLAWPDPEKPAMGFREEGYLPETMVNFLALLGWSPSSEQELFTMEELIETFTIEKIHKAGARFDIAKARWFNQQYLRQLPDTTLVASLQAQLPSLGTDVAEKIVHLLRDRINFPKELAEQARFLFEVPTEYAPDVIATKWNAEVGAVVGAFAEALPNPLTAENAKETLHHITEERGIKLGKVMQPLRVALTGAGAGPDLMLSMEIMGTAAVQERLRTALVTLTP